jgi:S-layer homology domain
MTDAPVSRARLLIAATAMVAALVGSVAGIAFANHQFPDVPDSQPHHDNINALVNAGCATGFEDGTYRPGDPVTRGQVARQVTQCGTRIAEAEASGAIADDNSELDVGTVAIRAGGQDAAHTGFIRLDGLIEYVGPSTQCPCVITAEFRNDNTGIDTGFSRTVIPSSEVCTPGGACGNLHIQDVVPAGNTTAGNTYRLQVRVNTAGTNNNQEVNGHIIAEYVPFGGDPTDT